MSRREFEMSQKQLDRLIDACTPQPLIAMQCGTPPSQQEKANGAWAVLGTEMGFAPMSVQPCEGKGQRHFSALATEPDIDAVPRDAS